MRPTAAGVSRLRCGDEVHVFGEAEVEPLGWHRPTADGDELDTATGERSRDACRAGEGGSGSSGSGAVIARRRGRRPPLADAARRQGRCRTESVRELRCSPSSWSS